MKTIEVMIKEKIEYKNGARIYKKKRVLLNLMFNSIILSKTSIIIQKKNFFYI